MMKDFLKRCIIGLFSGSFILYLLYLLIGGKIIVNNAFIEFNLIYLIILFVVGIYLFILFSIHPIYMKISKPSLFFMGIGLVLLGDNILINNPDLYIYISDLVKILGSLLVVLAWTNFFISAKVKKQKDESKLQIIEV